jgi:hypothetical protein
VIDQVLGWEAALQNLQVTPQCPHPQVVNWIVHPLLLRMSDALVRTHVSWPRLEHACIIRDALEIFGACDLTS